MAETESLPLADDEPLDAFEAALVALIRSAYLNRHAAEAATDDENEAPARVA